MTKIDKLIENLKLDAEWASANEWESPICLANDINDAIEILSVISILNQLGTLSKIKDVVEEYL